MKFHLLPVIALVCTLTACKPSTNSIELDLSGYNTPTKRGICYNKISRNATKLLSDGYVDWAYNWGMASENDYIGYNQPMAYAPMLWGNFDSTDKIEAYLQKDSNAYVLLGFNEPMMQYHDGGCQMTPARAAELWPQLEALAQKYNLKLVSPAITFGYEPIEDVIYRTPESWLDQFIEAYQQQHGKAPHFDYLGLHTYMNWPGAIVWFIDTYYARYNLPIYLTEFCAWGHGGDPWDDFFQLQTKLVTEYDYQQMTMTQKLEYLDQSPKVAGYNWFMADGGIGKEPWNGLCEGDKLTTLGKIYAYMSASDTTKYYQSGKYIPAAQYVSSSNYNTQCCEHFKTHLLFGDNTDTLTSVLPIEVRNFVKGRFVRYQIDVPATDKYTFNLRYRCDNNWQLMVLSGGDTLRCDVPGSLNNWQTLSTPIALKQGKQAIQLESLGGEATDIRISSWNFE